MLTPASGEASEGRDGPRRPRSTAAAAGGDAGRGGLLVADRREREGARAAQERPVTNVGAWLQGVGLGQYEAAVRDNGVVAAYHGRAAALIRGGGGFVAKYVGDGVLAYFGYPQAHEEDVECAVRAGLAIAQAVEK